MSAARGSSAARLLLVDKPAGVTSFDVVRTVRRVCGTRRVGHAGTLDPFATGLLVLGLGPATRLLEPLSAGEKTYLAEIRLGLETDTGDPTGTVVHRGREQVGEQELRQALRSLTGVLEQVPPIHSAIKVAGQRSYDRARRGEEFELPPREVVVHALDLVGVRPPHVEVRVRCGGGTYVRSLARDLGRAVGSAAHVSRLRREVVGPFTLEQAVALGDLERRWAEGDPTLDPVRLVEHWPRLELDDEQVERVRRGGQPVPEWWEGRAWADLPERVALLDGRQRLVAIAERDDERGLRLRMVLPEEA